MYYYNIRHLRAARPTINKIVVIMGVLSGLAIIGGIGAIVWNAYSPTEMSFIGASVSTGHVGVAFAALGLICMVAVMRTVLKTLHRLAELPDNNSRD